MPSRSPLPLATLAVLLIVIIAACTAAAPPVWNYGPGISSAAPSASAAPAASAGPSAGASAAASGAPAGSPGTDASAAPASGDPGASPAASGEVPAASPGTSNAAYTVVGSKPCPESRFECITLSVPKDHFTAPGGDTWDVTFAIQRAKKAKKGTFVVITGGPGYSGIASADSYTDYYASDITDSYDVVFMDQRGTGQSEPIQCVNAAAAYYQSSARPQVPSEREQAATDAQTFATDCIAEAGIAEADLPLYATRQAVEDLEAVRDYLGADKLQLYGESYGTQYVQTYAAAHPDRIQTLFLDGPGEPPVDRPTPPAQA
jgi:pimeloyl-ACP methyl ester carboxylesterase